MVTLSLSVHLKILYDAALVLCKSIKFHYQSIARSIRNGSIRISLTPNIG